jgi:phosphopantetheinyl transferase
VWHILENENELLGMANPDPGDLAILSAFRNGSRRKQWLACRVLLGTLMKLPFVKIVYDGNGKPSLKGFKGEISFSHTSEYAAVITDLSKPVGIDIEKLKPRIERVSNKFLNQAELDHITNMSYCKEDQYNGELPCGGEDEAKWITAEGSGVSSRRLELLYIYWCSKEALYKFYGNPVVDLKNDIHIQPFDYFCNLQGSLSAFLTAPEGVEMHQLHYEMISDHILVYTSN